MVVVVDGTVVVGAGATVEVVVVSTVEPVQADTARARTTPSASLRCGLAITTLRVSNNRSETPVQAATAYWTGVVDPLRIHHEVIRIHTIARTPEILSRIVSERSDHWPSLKATITPARADAPPTKRSSQYHAG